MTTSTNTSTDLIKAALHSAAIERPVPTEETILQQLFRLSQTYQAIATQYGLTFTIRSTGPESWFFRIDSAEGETLYSDSIRRKTDLFSFLKEGPAFKEALTESSVFRVPLLTGIINQMKLEMGVEGAVFVNPAPVAPVQVEAAPAPIQAPAVVVEDMARRSQKKYIAYYRVSTNKQGKSGLGLEAQIEDVKRFVNCEDCIIAEFTEVESGKKADRPELAKALAPSKETGATLIVSKLDRLSRDAEFIFKLMNSKVLFQCVDIPEMTNLTVGIFAVIADHERSLISKRTKAAFAAKKARGEVKVSGNNFTPEVVAMGHQAKRQAALKDEYALRAFPLIQALRKEKKTYRQIADILNESKYTTKDNKPFIASTVLRIERRLTEAQEKK